MKNVQLEKLVSEGQIVSYEYLELDCDGNPGQSDGRNTESLKLVFPNGSVLKLGTFCSGCLENTCLTFE